MKKNLVSLFSVFGIIFYSQQLFSATTICPMNSYYTSCNPGYYLVYNFCEVCPTDTYKDTTGSGGCTPCPYLDDVQGHTSGTSATNHDSVTDCFVLSGTSFSDITGSYLFTSNCYYSY